jgi:hypothetical protein
MGLTLRPPAPGSWTVTARRIGFGTVTSEAIEIQAYEQLVLEVIPTAEAVQLEPVEARHTEIEVR